MGDDVTIPPWADESFSNDLAVLRSKGEGQELEYIQEFPSQVRELAKEIAAFATSNPGTILIGVADNGDLRGLDGATTPDSRDQLLRRLEGICHGPIKPAITVRPAWAVEDERVVLVIDVPKGSEPVYYSEGKPYLRHMTAARPAEPHEVIELVRQHLAANPTTDSEESPAESAFHTNLYAILNRIFMWAETPTNDRQINPLFQEWRTDYEYAASELRELAAGDTAEELKLVDRLKEVAEALDAVANFRGGIGSGHRLDEVAVDAEEAARSLRDDVLKDIPLSGSALEEVRKTVRESSRNLTDLAGRADPMMHSGRLNELQSSLSTLGRRLMLMSFYNLDSLQSGLSTRLREIGLQLRLLGTMRLMMDGGLSVKELSEGVDDAATKLSDLALELGRQ